MTAEMVSSIHPFKSSAVLMTIQLVTSVEHIRETGHITEEWFGLVLLPMVSFSADAFVTIVYFLRAVFFLKPQPPETLAENRAIDMSIQFTLFWMPLLVLVAWIMDRPLLLLFGECR